MDITEWDCSEAVEDKIAVKHRVTLDEVDDCFFGSYPHVLRRGRAGLYALYGRSEAGRYLLVFFHL